MMRKVFAVIMAAVILVCGVGLADMPAIDYDSLTQEELVKMREAIDSRIQLVGRGDVVYEKDGYVIKWLGLTESGKRLYISMLVTNPNPFTVGFYISGICFNGIQFPVTSTNVTWYEIFPQKTCYVGTDSKGYNVKIELINNLGMTIDDIAEAEIHFVFNDKGDPFADTKVILEDTIMIPTK